MPTNLLFIFKALSANHPDRQFTVRAPTEDAARTAARVWVMDNLSLASNWLIELTATYDPMTLKQIGEQQ